MAGIEQHWMDLALAQARTGFEEGGLPIGAVLVRASSGQVLGAGHNRRVQDGDPIAHGEMDCLRRAGRLTAADYRDSVMVTTLAPCMMCSGTIVQFKIPRVVIGEATTFAGNLDFLRDRGVDVTVLDRDDCAALMARFQRDFPAIWAEDIAE